LSKKQESKNKGDQYWNQVTLSSKATQYTRGKIRESGNQRMRDTRAPGNQRTRKPCREPEDKRTRKPENQETREPGNQGTRKLEDQLAVSHRRGRTGSTYF
jgi:hypothetical protein